MTLALGAKLLSLLLTVAAGWLLGRGRWLADAAPSRTVGLIALYLFIPALMFRTTSRVDLSALPWNTLAALFVPLLAWQMLQWAWLRRDPASPPAAAGTRALATTCLNWSHPAKCCEGQIKVKGRKHQLNGNQHPNQHAYNAPE